MPKFKDLTGQRFGRLTVVSRAEKLSKAIRWNCICDCGASCIVQANHLTRGDIKSCGCLNTEKRFTHGLSHTRIYRVWRNIKDRCLNPNVKSYKNYGGRGITICDEWRDDFATFYDYVSKLEHFGEEGYSLDRIDNYKGYEPGNLRYADFTTQNRNQRGNHLVEYNGQMMSVAQAAEESGISADLLRTGIHRHGDNWENLFTPDKMQGGSERIPDDKRAQIIADYQPGVRGNGAKAVANRHNVSKTSVLNIIKEGDRQLCEQFIEQNYHD